MDVKQVLSFIKIEHTLFSLPFVLIGYMIALRQFNIEPGMDLVWILFAAVGARGLAMALNRIIDRDIDAANPRTQGRHLASGDMSMRTAWTLAAVFLIMLLVSAGLLNRVALMMAWLPVLTFVIYPYMKRFTWGCHFWLGLCLGLAPAGAWVAIAADVHGWAAITGMLPGGTEFLWAPTITHFHWRGVVDCRLRHQLRPHGRGKRPTAGHPFLPLKIWREGNDAHDGATFAALVRMLCDLGPHGRYLVPCGRCSDGAGEHLRRASHEPVCRFPNGALSGVHADGVGSFWCASGRLFSEVPDTCELVPIPSPFVELCESFFQT